MSKLEILHLEDDPALRDILQFTFSNGEVDAELAQFVSSDEAVNYIRTNAPQIGLFLLDIRVPGSLDGIGVAEFIREVGNTAPVYVTSAYEKPEKDVLESLRCEWMAKPWNLQTLLDMVVELQGG
jgi:DNA-binding response OmpR family regulator